MTLRSVGSHVPATGTLDWKADPASMERLRTSEDRLVLVGRGAEPCPDCGYTGESESPLGKRERLIKAGKTAALVLSAALMCALAVIGGMVVTIMGCIAWG